MPNQRLDRKIDQFREIYRKAGTSRFSLRSFEGGTTKCLRGALAVGDAVQAALQIPAGR